MVTERRPSAVFAMAVGRTPRTIFVPPFSMYAPILSTHSRSKPRRSIERQRMVTSRPRAVRKPAHSSAT
jgi:hypothetical protein